MENWNIESTPRLLEKIGESLKGRRLQKNISQEELARQISVSRQTINAMEKGKYVPSTLLALKLARFFNKQVEEIFELESTD